MTPGGGLSMGNLIAFLTINTVGFTRGLARASSSMKGFGGVMGGASSNVSLALLAIGAASTKMSIDFEKTFSEMHGLVGVAKDQVAAFREEVLDIAPDVARGPRELGDALRFITSSGFKGAQAMDILEKSAKTAAAGLGETRQISDLVTSAISAYGRENLTAAQTVDALVAAVREGKAEGGELANALGYVIPIAAEMGVEFNEVAAAIASMTRQGIGTSTAATNLRQLLSDLLDPSARAEAAMMRMGTSAEELRRSIKEDGLLSVLDFLKSRMEGNKSAFAEIFPNVRSLTGALALTGRNAEEVAQVFADLTDNTGDMEKGFQIASETASFKLNAAMADLEVSMIKLGDVIKPIWVGFVQGLAGVVSAFTGTNKAINDGTISLMGFKGIANKIAEPIEKAEVAAKGLQESLADATKNFLAISIPTIDKLDTISKLEAKIQEIKDQQNNTTASGLPLLKQELTYYEKQLAILEGIRDAEPMAKRRTGPYLSEVKDIGSFDPRGKPKKVSTGPPQIMMDSAKIQESVKAFMSYQLAVRNAKVAEEEWAATSAARYSEQMRQMYNQIDAMDVFGSIMQDSISEMIAGQTSFGEVMAQTAIQIIDAIYAIITARLLEKAVTKSITIWDAAAGVAAAAVVSGIAKGLLKKSVQGLASGGYVTSGGVFQLHKDELVSLPAGSAVTPANMAKGGGNGGGRLTTEFNLRKFIIELDQERERMGRG